MSFARLSSLESQPTTSRETGYSDDPEFHRLAQTLSSRLFNLTSNITKANHILSLLGTKKDSQETRDRLQNLLSETREGFKQIGEGVKRVQLWENVSPQQRFVQEKLSREFTAAIPDFQAVQKLSVEKQRKYVIQARSALDTIDGHGSATSPDAGETMPLVQQQTAQLQLASQSEVDFQESMIQEREEEIRDIEDGIMQLNEIFRDLGTMVNEQGHMVNRVLTNTDDTRMYTRDASRELTAASRSQKAARNRACCLLLILAVVLLIVLLAVLT